MRALVDTSALLALSRRHDEHHGEAVEIANRHAAGGGEYLGTTMVLGELYSHLLYLRGPVDARTAVTYLLDDPVHDWQAVSAELVSAAITNWLSKFQDQRFSLIDAVSFEVMRRAGVTHAFAFDHHFEVAGFHRLR